MEWWGKGDKTRKRPIVVDRRKGRNGKWIDGNGFERRKISRRTNTLNIVVNRLAESWRVREKCSRPRDERPWERTREKERYCFARQIKRREPKFLGREEQCTYRLIGTFQTITPLSVFSKYFVNRVWIGVKYTMDIRNAYKINRNRRNSRVFLF